MIQKRKVVFMQKCRDCQKDIDKKAKKCPYCQSKQGSWFSRHPILTGIFAIIIFISVVGALADDDSSTQSEISPSTTETREAVTDENDEIADELEADEVADDSTQETVSQKSAIRQANSYIRVSGFSRSGLIEQLEFVGFTNEQANYGADSVGL